jgi:hypothetical protein
MMNDESLGRLGSFPNSDGADNHPITPTSLSPEQLGAGNLPPTLPPWMVPECVEEEQLHHVETFTQRSSTYSRSVVNNQIEDQGATASATNVRITDSDQHSFRSGYILIVFIFT